MIKEQQLIKYLERTKLSRQQKMKKSKELKEILKKIHKGKKMSKFRNNTDINSKKAKVVTEEEFAKRLSSIDLSKIKIHLQE